MTRDEDSLRAEDSKWPEPRFPLARGAFLGLAALGIPASLLPAAKQNMQDQLEIYLVLLLPLPALILGLGAISCFEERNRPIGNWQIRAGRIGAWVLIVISPLALVVQFFYPSSSPIAQCVWTAVGIAASALYLVLTANNRTGNKVA